MGRQTFRRAHTSQCGSDARLSPRTFGVPIGFPASGYHLSYLHVNIPQVRLLISKLSDNVGRLYRVGRQV
jgi:hypothetical protein